jgi:hypothetical protein
MFACQISRFPQTDRNETERFSVGGHKTRQQRLQPPPQIPIGWPDRPATDDPGLRLADSGRRNPIRQKPRREALCPGPGTDSLPRRPGKTGCGHFDNTLRGKPAALRPDAPRQTFSP